MILSSIAWLSLLLIMLTAFVPHHSMASNLEDVLVSHNPVRYHSDERTFDVPKAQYEHVGPSNVVPHFRHPTNFKAADVSDGGDSDEGYISPCTFTFMARGTIPNVDLAARHQVPADVS